MVNRAAIKFLQWHNKGFCVRLFLWHANQYFCLQLLTTEAADLNTALKYSQTSSFSYSRKSWKNSSWSHLTCWATRTMVGIWMCRCIWMELYSCIICFLGNSSCWNGHQDKDCWPCSFFSFLTGMWQRANSIFKVVTDCNFFRQGM